MSSNSNNTATFRTENHTREFEGQKVRFQILASAVTVNVEDMIKAAKEGAVHLSGKPIVEVVQEFLKLSMHTRNEVDIIRGGNGEIDAWMVQHCAIAFACGLSKDLTIWCRDVCRELNQRLCQISDSLEKRRPNWFFKDLLMPRHDDYVYGVGNSMGDPVQTFLFSEHHITFRLMENANDDLQMMVNANQIVNVNKQDCSEWFDLGSTKQLTKACQDKNHRSIVVTDLEIIRDEILPVWMDLTLAEDLATWVTKDYELKLWLRNRAAELRFFYDNASSKGRGKMHDDDMYINSNCVISRT